MAKQVFGSGLDSRVAKQIGVREAVFAKKNSRTTTDIAFLNGSTAWVRLSSSVNTLDSYTPSPQEQGTASQASCNEGEKNLANSLILFGGTLTPEHKLRAGFGNESSTSTSKSAYHKSKSTGFRPMPGITSISVASKGEFGSLKESNIKLKVWSREDLDDMDRVYFRVGYSALLEFGHSVYLSNQGEIQTISKKVGVDSFFSSNSSEQVVTEIDNMKKKYDFNYEALFGFVTNFSWTLNSDGSYDCSIKLVSKGVIIEASKETTTVSQEVKEKQDEQKAEADTQKLKSLLHYILYQVEGWTILGPVSNLGEVFTLSENEQLKGKVNRLNEPFAGSSVSVGTGNYMFTRAFYNDRISIKYVRLNFLLKMLNAFVMVKDKTGQTICGFEEDSVEPYTTYPGHFTCDPLAVLIPKTSTTHGYAKFEKDGVHDGICSSSAGGTDHIANISISTHVLKDLLDQMLDSPPEPGTGIFEFMEKVLSTINFALGGINNLSIFYDDVTQLHKIIDKTAPGLVKGGKTAPKINISGLGATVLDVSVNSEITSEMSSMVAIAAQAGTGKYKANLQNILAWNRGCIDRHHTFKATGDTGNSSTDTETQEREVPFGERFKEAWEKINSTTGDINPEIWSTLKSEAQDVILAGLRKNKFSSSIPNTIPMPISLNIKLLGIGGWKVGQCFKLDSSIIPSQYKEWGFLIVKADQEIGTDNKWVTTIAGKMFKL